MADNELFRTELNKADNVVSITEPVDKKSIRLQLREAMLAGEIYNNNPDDSPEKCAMRARHEERLRNFLDFEVLPDRNTEPDFIVVTGGSPFIDNERYKHRVQKGVELAQVYSRSQIIFSGNMPHQSRRTGMERKSEAEMMALDAADMGIEHSRIILEPESNHLKENIENSIRLLLEQINSHEGCTKIVIVTPQSAVRRAYYSAEKIMKEAFPDLQDKVKLFFIPSDHDLADEGRIFYEMRRLSEYRAKGWL